MNEESTRNLSHARSFEERVFARFDAIDNRLEKLEARNYDTKPIWERALAAIMETGLEVGGLKTQVSTIEGKVGVIGDKVGTIEGKVSTIEGKVGVIEGKVGTIEGKVGTIEGKVGTIEGKVSTIEGKVGVIENELETMKRTIRDGLVDVRRELKHHVGARLDMILKIIMEDRDDIRDAEERIRVLERKFA